MRKLFKLAQRFRIKYADDVELKPYRKRLDNDVTENLLETALEEHSGQNIDVSYNNQHYGWFIWDDKEKRHEQHDMNDFKGNDTVGDVRELVHGLKKIKLEDYEN